jgi:Protein of unknown function (DUF1203)
MSAFRVMAIPTDVTEAVRSSGKTPRYGPAHKEFAAGRAPCRHCLKLIASDQELLLFTFDPFCEHLVPPLPGPVYIHAEACTRAQTPAIPEEYRGRPLTLLAYGEDRKLISEIRVTDGEEEKVGAEMLANSEVNYVHVRSTEAGCFLFRLERN